MKNTKILFMSRCLLALMACVGHLTSGAQANDGNIVGTGGRWQFMRGEHRSVQMVREKIIMTVRPDSDAEIVADFWFQNHGPATTVTMGFPEKSDGVDIGTDRFRKRSHFKQFRSWVDGRPIKVRRVVTDIKDEYARALWIKNVHFAHHEGHRVRVRYTTNGGADSSGYRSHEYSFTGGNWQGNVRESLLTVKFLTRGAWWVSNKGWKGNQLAFRRENWQAEDNFEIAFISTLPSDQKDPRQSNGESWHFIQNPGHNLRQGIICAAQLPPIVQEEHSRWIPAEALGAMPLLNIRWNESNNNVVFWRGKRQLVIKSRDAKRNSAKSPHRSGKAFYVMRGGWLQLYIPIERFQSALGLKIGFDETGKIYLYEPVTKRRIQPSNGSSS